MKQVLQFYTTLKYKGYGPHDLREKVKLKNWSLQRIEKKPEKVQASTGFKFIPPFPSQDNI